jgi:hypothetical protein
MSYSHIEDALAAALNAAFDKEERPSLASIASSLQDLAIESEYDVITAEEQTLQDALKELRRARADLPELSNASGVAAAMKEIREQGSARFNVRGLAAINLKLQDRLRQQYDALKLKQAALRAVLPSPQSGDGVVIVHSNTATIVQEVDSSARFPYLVTDDGGAASWKRADALLLVSDAAPELRAEEEACRAELRAAEEAERAAIFAEMGARVQVAESEVEASRARLRGACCAQLASHARSAGLAMQREAQRLHGLPVHKSLDHALDDEDAAVVALRACMQQAQRVVDAAQERLGQILQVGKATSRAGYLTSIGELIGPKPDRSWRDEWVPLMGEHLTYNDGNFGDGRTDAEVREENEAYVRDNASLEQIAARWPVDHFVTSGWSHENAKMYSALKECVIPLARSLREKDPRFAASTYALCAALYDQRASPERGTSPRMFRPLRDNINRVGKGGSLVSQDPAWDELEEPDSTGFRGLTCSALVWGATNASSFSEHGFLQRDYDAEQKEESVLIRSDIVAFDSRADDSFGCHNAIPVPSSGSSQGGAVFPPNTLFRLQKIHPAGTWEAPGGVRPQQRLLVVTATFQPPQIERIQGGRRPKMCGSTVALQYGSRSAYVTGLDDLIAKPLLSLAAEYDRDMAWTDWKGVGYNLRDEWRYVNGPASKADDCTPGVRDDGENDGMTVEDFMEKVNSFIRKRRAGMLRAMLPEEVAYLTRDEVLAVRLYSGPCYQVINRFLRQIAPLSGRYREQIAQHAQLSFAATVAHICRAIRKLAAVTTPEEAAKPLWRGVRGELPRTFWVPDEQGMVVAVDMAFMSTSRNRQTPIDYMGSGSNVLWQLQPQQESDSGFHCGADISMLSQFAAEAECLFPPCTMLEVKRRAPGEKAECAPSGQGRDPRDPRSRFGVPTDELQAEQTTESERSLLRVLVVPHFL